MVFMLAHGDGDIFGSFSVWTFVLRFGQYLLQIAPHLLVGLALTGLLGTHVGNRWLHGCLNVPSNRAVPRAILLGLLMPVGSLGVLPIASQMLRAGIKPRTVMSFLVTAPMFMPWSFGYASDSIGIANTAMVVLGGTLIAYLVGATTNFWPRQANDISPESGGAQGSQLSQAVRLAAWHSSGWFLICVLIGLAASAAFAAVLEPGSIEAHLSERSVGTLFELAVPISLAVLEPDIATMYAGEFYRIGMLTGGVFLSIYLGAAWSLGLFAWCIRHLGRTGLVATVVWLLVAMFVCVAGNSIVQPSRPGEADSHGFDVLTKPHNFGSTSAAAGVADQLRRAATENGVALTALVALIVAGGVIRLRSRTGPTTLPGEGVPSEKQSDSSPIAVRGTFVVAITLCAVISLYSYFPPVDELRARLRLQSGNLSEAAATMESSIRIEEHRVAHVRALNALDRIDDALGRYQLSRTIRFWDDSPPMDASQLRDSVKRIRQTISKGGSVQIRQAALDLAKQVIKDHT